MSDHVGQSVVDSSKPDTQPPPEQVDNEYHLGQGIGNNVVGAPWLAPENQGDSSQQLCLQPFDGP